MNEYDDYVNSEVASMWMAHEEFVDLGEVTDEDIEWACAH